MDYGELRVYPGNYDDFMMASTQARERLLSENAKKKTQITELQAFVSRFSANASKAKQATSRARQIEKIQLEDVKPSSRVSPYIRFVENKRLHRQALIMENAGKAFDKSLFSKLGLQIEAGERVAIIGPNGAGKTTLLRCMMQEVLLDSGKLKWAEQAEIGYFAQDHGGEFVEQISLFDWMKQWTKGDQQLVRSALGRMLFSSDDVNKTLPVLSGGEKARMLFGKFSLINPNVLIMDEPTNHLDMESIEALNLALENYPGTLIFVSHDREFVSSLATRIIDMQPTGLIDFKGNYEDYLRSQGIY
jgi:ATPase subunit of ABC transporter with duplicated ATPase domains